MDKKKIVKGIVTGVVFLIPFGMSVIVGYYGYKKYAKYKSEKDKKKLEK